ncbi:hypothetical protein Tco_1393296 [Tanacetum coccineum]
MTIPPPRFGREWWVLRRDEMQIPCSSNDVDMLRHHLPIQRPVTQGDGGEIVIPEVGRIEDDILLIKDDTLIFILQVNPFSLCLMDLSPFLFIPVIPPYLLSCGDEDTIFDPGISKVSFSSAEEVDIIKKTENQAKMTKLSMEWKRLCKIKAKVQKCQSQSQYRRISSQTGAGTEEYYWMQS